MSHDHDRGLLHDLKLLQRQTDRRRMLRWMAGSLLLPVVGLGCKTSTGSSGDGSCSTIPEETAGPYPGDGSNGPNALLLSGIVRSDMRSSVAGASGTADGIALTVTLTLVQTIASCEPLAGYAIYLWHCDAEGRYSMYDLTDQNYLRAVQETGDDGSVTFTTIFPGCYAGRMPHMHFEVYPSLDSIRTSGNKIATSQLAFPEDLCDTVYGDSRYPSSARNFSSLSFDSDNVFRDGVEQQLVSISGDVASGLTASLLVGVQG